MDITTLSVDESTREQFKAHRHDAHHNEDEVLKSMMAVLPTYKQLREDGCVNCGNPPIHDAPLDRSGGVIEYFRHTDTDYDAFYANWYCSHECFIEQREEINHQFPRHPDAVVVGGMDELRFAIEGNSELIITGPPSVTFDHPVALDDYVGEPIYIYHRGQWGHHGVIDDVFHEEAHTSVNITPGGDNRDRFYHPDDDERESYREGHSMWYDADCPACGTKNRVDEGTETQVCPDCDTGFEPGDVPMEKFERFYEGNREDRTPRSIMQTTDVTKTL